MHGSYCCQDLIGIECVSVSVGGPVSCWPACADSLSRYRAEWPPCPKAAFSHHLGGPGNDSRQQPPFKKPTETPLKNNHTQRFPQKTSPAVLSPESAGLIPNWGSFLLFAGARASCCSDAAVLEVPRKIGCLLRFLGPSRWWIKTWVENLKAHQEPHGFANDYLKVCHVTVECNSFLGTGQFGHGSEKPWLPRMKILEIDPIDCVSQPRS